MGNMVLLFSNENERMKQDLMWVMREAIPRMLMRVLRSKEFDLEMMKAVAGLKKETWAYMDTIIKAPKLSYALLRYVLRHGGSGQGSSANICHLYGYQATCSAEQDLGI
ncbi:hypothetical protein Tco_0262152 [Tanacetum coccineum]